MSNGTIYRRRNGTWESALDLGMFEGRRIRVARSSETKRQAAEELERLRAEHDNALEPEAAVITMGVFVDRFLNAVKATVRETTFVGYEQRLRSHVVPHIGSLPLSRLHPLVFQALYAHLFEQGLSNRSRKDVHAMIRICLNWAVAWGLLKKNPVIGVRVPHIHRRTDLKALTKTEVRRLLRAAKGHRYYAFIALALATGAREGELLGLRQSDVDLTNGTLRIEQSLVEVHSKLSISAPKTKASRRVVSLPTWALEAAQAHIMMLKAEGYTGEYLFVGERKHRLLHKTYIVSKVFHPLIRKAGLRRSTVHRLRHTAATNLLADGVPVQVVARRLGHADPTVTLKVYSHVLPTMQREAARKLDKFLREHGVVAQPIGEYEFR